MRRHDLASWQQRLRAASTPRHVLVVANEFLQQLSYADRAFLPEGCKPRRLDSIPQLNEYAYDLKAAAASATADTREAAAFVATILQEACHQLAEMTGAHRPIPHLPDSELKLPSSE